MSCIAHSRIQFSKGQRNPTIDQTVFFLRERAGSRDRAISPPLTFLSLSGTMKRYCSVRVGTPKGWNKLYFFTPARERQKREARSERRNCVGQNEIGLVRFFVRTKKRTIGRNDSLERSRPGTNEGPGGGTLTLLTTELN